MSRDLGDHSNSGWSFPDARPIQRPGNSVQNEAKKVLFI